MHCHDHLMPPRLLLQSQLPGGAEGRTGRRRMHAALSIVLMVHTLARVMQVQSPNW